MDSGSKQDSLFVDAFHRAICNELDDAVRKILHCAEQLSEDQIWWRPDESMNSIANLMLHLCGNLRQWVVAGVGGAEDRRNRPMEFAQRDRIPMAQLIQMLEGTAKEVRQTLDRVTPEELVRIRTIQGFDVSGIQAVVESIAHFRGHTQEITHMTRIMLGESYKFDFVPAPNQQGGAAT